LTREALNVEPAVSKDGRFVVFMSNRAGTVNLWRTDLNGGNPLRLTTGTLDVDPSLTPDGRWVVYLDPGTGKLWRVPMEGGDPVEVRATRGGPGRVSPDGRFILTGSFSAEAGHWQAEVIPFEGGEPVATFYEPNVGGNSYRWAPDGDISYVKIEDGVGNLWQRSLGGGEPTRVTEFDADRIQDHAWSRDGSRVVVARGDNASDIVLLRDFRRER